MYTPLSDLGYKERIIYAGGHVIEVEEYSAALGIPLGKYARGRTLGIEVSNTKISPQLMLVAGGALIGIMREDNTRRRT